MSSSINALLLTKYDPRVLLGRKICEEFARVESTTIRRDHLHMMDELVVRMSNNKTFTIRLEYNDPIDEQIIEVIAKAKLELSE